MHDSIVDAAAARGGIRQHPADRRAVGAEKVEGQRLGAGVDLPDGLVEGIEREDRQQRAEDFLRYEGAFLPYVGQDGRTDTPGGGICISSDTEHTVL